MDYYTKRDDDSAIGDSANNSAEEESSNPGRKSIISDDSSDLPLEIHNQLSSKIGIQIPDCLINESEESQTDGRKARKFETSSKSRRENLANSSRNNKSSDKRKDSNQMDLQVQLNFLLNEMVRCKYYILFCDKIAEVLLYLMVCKFCCLFIAVQYCIANAGSY